MKIVFIAPRMEKNTLGGAERLILSLAGEIKAKGYRAEIYTTCSASHEYWSNDYPEGETFINDIRVRRFKVNERDSAIYHAMEKKIFKGTASENDIKMWALNSVHSDSLYQTIEKEKDTTKAFIFAPYLWGLTYKGSSIAPDKSVVIPCFHDEAFAYTSPVKEMVKNVRALIFNTEEEKELAASIYPALPEKTAVIGMAVNESPADPARFRNMYNIHDPFMLYAGRMEGGKNIHLLSEYFLYYKTRHNNNLRLCLMGKGNDMPVPAGKHGSIINLGFIPEEYKYDAYSAALFFCQPSVNESFSIVLLESLLNNTPGLVNIKSPVLSGHIKRSAGGLIFKDYPSFEAALNLMLENNQACEEMGTLGKKYVLNNFSSAAISKKLCQFIESLD